MPHVPAFAAALPLWLAPPAPARAPAAPRCVAAPPRRAAALAENPGGDGADAAAAAAAQTPAPRVRSRVRGNGGRGSRVLRPDAGGAARRKGTHAAKKEPAAERRLRLAAEMAERRESAVKAGKEGARAARAGGEARRRIGEMVVGERVRGRVRNLVRHGAYVDVGSVRDGLVHIRDMSVDFVYEPGDVVREREEVWVWVKYVDAVKGVIGLTMVPPAGAVGFSGRLPVSELAIGGRYEGVIARVTNYGAYVDIGAERHGFVHVSALWGRRPRETLENLRLGHQMWVLVDEVDEVKSFIRLRARGRRDGEELDETSELDDDMPALAGGGAVAEGAEEGAAPKMPVPEEIVLQRFGEEPRTVRAEDMDEDEEDEDEDEDDDYEYEDMEDEFELDFEQQVAARFQAPREYVDDDDDDDDVLGDDDEERDIGEQWSDPTDYASRGVSF